jgi:hypothetical protein
MMSETAANGQEDLETVLLDFLGAIRTGDREAMRAVLDPTSRGRVCRRTGSATDPTK